MEIIKLRSQFFSLSEQVTTRLRLAQNTLLRLGRGVADRPRRLREVLRARENDLRKLLASSLDAIVVTNVNCRFVAANPKALDLFGVSEANMKEFAIEAFLSHGQIPSFAGHGSSFIRREKRQGKCKIRRLDGSLRIAEYIFVPNFVPNRHLCRFRNIKTVRFTLVATSNRATAVIQTPASTLRTLGNRFDRCQSPARFPPIVKPLRSSVRDVRDWLIWRETRAGRRSRTVKNSLRRQESRPRICWPRSPW